MYSINYAKYTANGNNFIILDEIRREYVPESKKSDFSKLICHETTGIGCDTLIIVQRYAADVLNKIYGNNDFKSKFENEKKFIMRVFERDGSESYNCGNGLICLGHYMHNNYLIDNTCIATEIPSRKPFFRKVESLDANLFQATLGTPQLPNENFVEKSAIKEVLLGNTSYLLNPSLMQVNYKNKNGKINLIHCHLTFTGEPHVVIFEPTIFYSYETSNILNMIFMNLFDLLPEKDLQNQAENIVAQTGLHFNKTLRNWFPQGVNVSFARILDNGDIAYRCFERGVNSETYACGTGAVAVASIAREMKFTDKDEIKIIPWRARYESQYKNAEIIIKKMDQQYSLSTRSVLLSEGIYYISQ